MTSKELLARRLQKQQLARPAKSPLEAVRQLLAVQAQDRNAALWAVGIRSENSTLASIEEAIANKQLVRSWPMRGTLHLVAAEDLRWMLAHLAPRVLASIAGRYRQLSLDEPVFAKARKLAAAALKNGRARTRDELLQTLQAAKISTEGQRGPHILQRLALEGLIAFGPMIGKQPSFVWLDDWIAETKAIPREEALGILASRYFAGHGPATAADFAWWAGLKSSDAKQAIESIRGGLLEEKLGEQIFFSSNNSAPRTPEKFPAQLLPGFDEYILGYADRSAILEAKFANRLTPWSNGQFQPTLLLEGKIAGTWKRIAKKNQLAIQLHPFQPLAKNELQQLEATADRFASFMQLPLADLEVTE